MRTSRNIIALAGWMALTFCAAATGVFVSTDGWYAELVKPSWTPLFFGLHRPGMALAEILVLLPSVVATMIAFRRVRLSAGLLLLPYALWVGFATVLNFTIWRLNG